MTPEQISMVRHSFARIIPISDIAAELFYIRLTSLDPDMKRLFNNDVKEEGHKLMQMISIAVNDLDQLEDIMPVIEDLGRHYLDCGITDKDFDKMGNALLWTLEQGLDTDFTDELRAAWTKVYSLLAARMKDA